MNFFRKSIFAVASFAMLTACSSDEPFAGDTPNGGGAQGEGVYMGLTIKMPGGEGSRSQTETPGQSTDGNETGKNYENYVDNVIIVLADRRTNGFITAGEVSHNKMTPVEEKNAYKTFAKVDKTRLNTYYNQSTDREVNVFVFCNPTPAMRETFTSCAFGDTEWAVKATTTVSEDATEIASTAGNGYFLMSNFALAPRELPAHIDDWDHYKTEALAFDLSGKNENGSTVVDNSETVSGRGAVKVERAAARFDFKDGSDGNNTYNVVKDGEQTLIQIKLGKMALVNLSKEFYNLRRVSDNGLNTGAQICGAETPTNYVVGPNADVFLTALNNNFGFNPQDNTYDFDFAPYFHNPFFNKNGMMDYNQFMGHVAVIDEFLGNTNNPSDEWKDKKYKIWHYAAENVIPATPSNQQNGISTGVLFKGKMIATEALKATNEALFNALNGTGITGDPDKDPILYSFNGNLYLTWKEVRKAAIAASVLMENGVPVLASGSNDVVASVNRTNTLYVAVFGKGGIGSFEWGGKTYRDTEEVATDCADKAWSVWQGNQNATTLATMRQKVTGAGFTIYQSSSDDKLGGAGYYCYYIYWNRHNDNLKPGTMGIMEFSVVRNNVYKLAVTNIKQLGHPRIPENDPDRPKPDTPDESTDIYMTVTCEVLPWVVRVNNIEF